MIQVDFPLHNDSVTRRHFTFTRQGMLSRNPQSTWDSGHGGHKRLLQTGWGTLSVRNRRRCWKAHSHAEKIPEGSEWLTGTLFIVTESWQKALSLGHIYALSHTVSECVQHSLWTAMTWQNQSRSTSFESVSLERVKVPETWGSYAPRASSLW